MISLSSFDVDRSGCVSGTSCCDLVHLRTFNLYLHTDTRITYHAHYIRRKARRAQQIARRFHQPSCQIQRLRLGDVDAPAAISVPEGRAHGLQEICEKNAEQKE